MIHKIIIFFSLFTFHLHHKPQPAPTSQTDKTEQVTTPELSDLPGFIVPNSDTDIMVDTRGGMRFVHCDKNDSGVYFYLGYDNLIGFSSDSCFDAYDKWSQEFVKPSSEHLI